MTVKTQLCLCNIQGVYTNVSAEKFVYTPRILHIHSCVLTVILYEFV